MLRLRLAKAEDAEQILRIYAPYVRETSVTFEEEPPTVEDVRQKIQRLAEFHPWFVMLENETVIGYAHSSPYSPRAAYRWTADATVYVDPRYRKRNVGRALYTALLNILHLQGYQTLYAKLSVPNSESETFHRRLGFRAIAGLGKVGYKHGKWHSVAIMAFKVREDDPPPEIRPVDEVIGSPEWIQIISNAKSFVKS